MQTLHEAYVMKNIDPSNDIFLGQVLSVMRRGHKAELLEKTKYIRIRENQADK